MNKPTIAARMALLSLVVSLLVLLAACAAPFSPIGDTSPTAQLTITLASAASAGDGSQSRTILPAFSQFIDSWEVTLTSQYGLASRSASSTDAAASLSFNDLEYGLWDIAVSAKKAGVVTATGSLKNQDIACGATLSLAIPLLPVAVEGGSGDLSLAIEFPSASADWLECWLQSDDGSTVSSSTQTPVLSASSGTSSASYALTGLASGAYTLKMSFRLGGVDGSPVGVFSESVNIMSGCTSNQWVDAQGKLVDKRSFSADEFFDSSTSLASLSLVPAANGFAFSPAVRRYDLAGASPASMLTFKAGAAIAGQSISYSWNGGTATAIASGTSSTALSIATGLNILVITVTAADRSTSATYTVYASSASSVTSSTGIALVWVPGGSFQRDAGGANVSTVGSFMIGKYEVTQAQWQAVTGTVATAANKPLTGLTWFDMVDFCNKLSLLENLETVYALSGVTSASGHITAATVSADWTKSGYRLPTEMEWDWAAMGATSGKGYTSGTFTTGYTKAFAGDDPASADDALGDSAWYTSNSGGGLHPVGQLKPNELGLYDMSGNATEWVWDCNAAYPSGTQVNYHNDSGSVARVHRGGSYVHSSAYLSLATRMYASQDSLAGIDLGFRLARPAIHQIIYQMGTATGGNLPADPRAYAEGTTAALKTYGDSTLVGPLIQDGITRRLVGWNTAADGSGTDYSFGQTVTIGTSDLVLYPKWTTGASVVGNIGPAGGYVFHDQGTVINGWRYMEVSPSDVCVRGTDLAPWRNGSDIAIPSAQNSAVGSGPANTAAIITVQGAPGDLYAAYRCREYRGGGYADWFLPSKDELALIHSRLRVPGVCGFTSYNHLTSTQNNSMTVWVEEFTNTLGTQVAAGNHVGNFAIRAARAFRDASPAYAIVYDKNGATSGSLNSVEFGSVTTVNTVQANSGNLGKTGYFFGGWNTLATGAGSYYAPGGSLPPSYGQLYLYAEWWVINPLLETWTTSVSGGNPLFTASQSVAKAGNTLTLNYNNNGAPGSGVPLQTWIFKTTATQTGTLSFTWYYWVNHCYAIAQAGLQMFTGSTYTDLVPYPSSGYAGTTYASATQVTLAVVAGQEYGFVVKGANSDSNSYLSGNVVVTIK